MSRAVASKSNELGQPPDYCFLRRPLSLPVSVRESGGVGRGCMNVLRRCPSSPCLPPPPPPPPERRRSPALDGPALALLWRGGRPPVLLRAVAVCRRLAAGAGEEDGVSSACLRFPRCAVDMGGCEGRYAFLSGLSLCGRVSGRAVV